MLVKKILPIAVSGMMISHMANAQLFETRSTRYSGTRILDSLNNTGSKAQMNIRESIIAKQASSLAQNDSIETYFDGHYMGLVTYRDRKPYNLIGFWDPEGNVVEGGYLLNGSGKVKTPFNPKIVSKFNNETVVYESGMKNGTTFYYCDCASVLRWGTFKDNKKEGLWKEYTPAGKFIQQKEIEAVEEVIVDVIAPDGKDWLGPAHCMMKNPNDINIECPK